MAKDSESADDRPARLGGSDASRHDGPLKPSEPSLREKDIQAAIRAATGAFLGLSGSRPLGRLKDEKRAAWNAANLEAANRLLRFVDASIRAWADASLDVDGSLALAEKFRLAEQGFSGAVIRGPLQMTILEAIATGDEERVRMATFYAGRRTGFIGNDGTVPPTASSRARAFWFDPKKCRAVIEAWRTAKGNGKWNALNDYLGDIGLSSSGVETDKQPKDYKHPLHKAWLNHQRKRRSLAP